MGLFSQMGDMYKLQKEAKRLKAELAQTHISAEESGIKVVVTGEQEVIEFEILDSSLLTDGKKLNKSLIKATNKALKKSQQIAAEKMKPLMGGLGMG